MSQVKTHATEVQKKTEPARQLEQEVTRQSEQGPVQQVAPQAAYRRAQVNSSGLRAADLLALQRTVGNRRVQRMVARHIESANGPPQSALAKENPEIKVQSKFTVGAPDDIYEQEADHVADQVMRMPEAESGKEQQALQPKPFATPTISFIQRQAADEAQAEDELQTKEQPGQAPTVTPDLESRLQASQGKGQPLPPETSALMEPRFGHNFGQVRVHADGERPEMNRALQAQVFTHKQDFFFGAGKYSPESGEEKHLLAHELTHVVQQGGEQLQRERTPAKEGPATGCAPSGWEEAPLKFLSTIIPAAGDARTAHMATAVQRTARQFPVLVRRSISSPVVARQSGKNAPQLAAPSLPEGVSFDWQGGGMEFYVIMRKAWLLDQNVPDDAMDIKAKNVMEPLVRALPKVAPWAQKEDLDAMIADDRATIHLGKKLRDIEGHYVIGHLSDELIERLGSPAGEEVTVSIRASEVAVRVSSDMIRRHTRTPEDTSIQDEAFNRRVYGKIEAATGLTIGGQNMAQREEVMRKDTFDLDKPVKEMRKAYVLNFSDSHMQELFGDAWIQFRGQQATGGQPGQPKPGARTRPAHPDVKGKYLGTWSESVFGAKITGEDEITRPGRTKGTVEDGFETLQEALAYAAVEVASRHADGGVIIQQNGLHYAFAVNVHYWLEHFTRENLEEGMSHLDISGSQVSGVQTFVTEDGYAAPFTMSPSPSPATPTTIVTRGKTGKYWHSTKSPADTGFKSMLNDIAEGRDIKLSPEGYVAMFKGLLRANALKQLEENRKRLADEETKYQDTKADNKAWQQLRQMIEVDREMAKRQQAYEKKASDIESEISRAAQRAKDASYLLGPAAILQSAQQYEPKYKEMTAYQEAAKDVKLARNRLRVEYPALAVLKTQDIAPTASNQDVFNRLSAGVKDVQKMIANVYTRIHEDDIPLTKLGPMVNQTKQQMNVTDGKRKSGDPMSKAVLDWLDHEDTKEEFITWSGTILSGGLAIGAILASGGTALILGVGGAVAGLGTAAYEFERAEDLYAAAKAGTGGGQLVDDPEAAKFNYIMGWVNLFLAGLDVGLAAKAGITMLKGARAAEKLAGMAGSEVLKGLKPEQIVEFDRAMQLRRAGQTANAEKILTKLKTQLGEETFSKANSLFGRASTVDELFSASTKISDNARRALRDLNEAVLRKLPALGEEAAESVGRFVKRGGPKAAEFVNSLGEDALNLIARTGGKAGSEADAALKLFDKLGAQRFAKVWEAAGKDASKLDSLLTRAGGRPAVLQSLLDRVNNDVTLLDKLLDLTDDPGRLAVMLDHLDNPADLERLIKKAGLGPAGTPNAGRLQTVLEAMGPGKKGAAEIEKALEAELKVAAESLAKDVGLKPDRLQKLLTALPEDRIRHLHRELQPDVFKVLGHPEHSQKLIENFSKALDLAGGDKAARDAIAEILRLRLKGVTAPELEKALADLVSFMDKYHGRIFGDFASRFLRAVTKRDPVEARAEIKMAEDLLEGRTPLGQHPDVHGIPESRAKGVQTPEYRVSGAQGGERLVEVKTIGVPKKGVANPLKEGALRRDLDKAISQIKQEATKGETGGFIRLDASNAASTTMTHKEILAAVKGELWSPRPGRLGKEVVEYVEVLYKADTATTKDVLKRLLLRVLGDELVIVL